MKRCSSGGLWRGWTDRVGSGEVAGVGCSSNLASWWEGSRSGTYPKVAFKEGAEKLPGVREGHGRKTQPSCTSQNHG